MSVHPSVRDSVTPSVKFVHIELHAQLKMTIIIFINNPPKASASFHIEGILFNLYQFGFPLLYHKHCHADRPSPQEYPGAFDGGFELLHADRH